MRNLADVELLGPQMEEKEESFGGGSLMVNEGTIYSIRPAPTVSPFARNTTLAGGSKGTG